ncbi:MAG: hypothetical protein DRO05_00930 [Thermoproteota archaeon]|nr:MAG: hypothetical protein DRO05_00930 [Candidatus Korarchaeota archaeon]
MGFFIFYLTAGNTSSYWIEEYDAGEGRKLLRSFRRKAPAIGDSLWVDGTPVAATPSPGPGLRYSFLYSFLLTGSWD